MGRSNLEVKTPTTTTLQANSMANGDSGGEANEFGTPITTSQTKNKVNANNGNNNEISSPIRRIEISQR